MTNLNLLLDDLKSDSLGRLRWRVLREFGILPGSRTARKLTDAELILCGLHMLLDRPMPPFDPTAPPFDPTAHELNPTARPLGDANPAFDLSRFEELGGVDYGRP